MDIVLGKGIEPIQILVNTIRDLAHIILDRFSMKVLSFPYTVVDFKSLKRLHLDLELTMQIGMY